MTAKRERKRVDRIGRAERTSEQNKTVWEDVKSTLSSCANLSFFFGATIDNMGADDRVQF